MRSKIVMAFILGVLVVFLFGASYFTTQQILNRVLVVGGEHINTHLTTQQAINAVYSPADTAINIWLEKVNAAFVYNEFIHETDNVSVGSGGSGDWWGAYNTIYSTDNLVLDSLLLLVNTSHNDVYLDSFAIRRGMTRVASDNTFIFGDGTNIGAGDVLYHGHMYTIGVTVSYDWRHRFTVYSATSGVAGNTLVWSAKAFLSY